MPTRNGRPRTIDKEGQIKASHALCTQEQAHSQEPAETQRLALVLNALRSVWASEHSEHIYAYMLTKLTAVSTSRPPALPSRTKCRMDTVCVARPYIMVR